MTGFNCTVVQTKYLAISVLLIIQYTLCTMYFEKELFKVLQMSGLVELLTTSGCILPRSTMKCSHIVGKFCSVLIWWSGKFGV